jgi:methionyl-tRNA formyltransferase
MKVLILSPYPDGLLPALDAFSDEYRVTAEPVTSRYCSEEGFDFLVSYGYRYILGKDLLDLFPVKAVNLHISLLPYCRGAHPVFWSILDEKQLGVTIHLLDEGLDTGNILFQQVTPLSIDRSESFSALHQKLRDSVEFLFRYNWKYLRTGECSGWKQQGSPTQHRSRELKDWLDCMPQQWDTLVSDFCKLAKIRHPLVSGD